MGKLKTRAARLGSVTVSSASLAMPSSFTMSRLARRMPACNSAWSSCTQQEQSPDKRRMNRADCDEEAEKEAEEEEEREGGGCGRAVQSSKNRNAFMCFEITSPSSLMSRYWTVR